MPLTKLNGFTFNHSEQPNDISSIDSEIVKLNFDSRAEEVRVSLNNLIDSLQSVVDGDSGADNIKATQIATSPTNIQGILEWLYQQIQNSTLGQIPDGSITDSKLSNDTNAIKQRFNTHLINYSNYTMDNDADKQSMNTRVIGGMY